MGMKRNRKRTLGMAMVEMIFVLPLLILLVFAIAEFGLMFSRWLTLSNAVREGARAGVAWRGPSCVKTTVEDDVQKTAGAYARSGGVPLANTDFTVQGACAGGGTDLIVSASYTFKLNIPYGSLASVPIAYKSTMRNEGFPPAP
jgi:Flp pilus assembly protein TadG